jgi:hypothetical protein
MPEPVRVNVALKAKYAAYTALCSSWWRIQKRIGSFSVLSEPGFILLMEDVQHRKDFLFIRQSFSSCCGHSCCFLGTEAWAEGSLKPGLKAEGRDS